MASITQVDMPESLRTAWGSLFRGADPFSYPFVDSVPAAMIFYPTEYPHLTPAQFDAVTAAARTVGDDHFILSVTERDVDRPDHLNGPWHWMCRYPTYAEYERIDMPPLENALYSPRGTWGVVLSHEDHAVVGGITDFIRSVQMGYGQWRDDVPQLAEAWQANSNRDWLDQLLDHEKIRQ